MKNLLMTISNDCKSDLVKRYTLQDRIELMANWLILWIMFLFSYRALAFVFTVVF